MKIVYTLCSICLLALHVESQTHRWNEQRNVLNRQNYPTTGNSAVQHLKERNNYDKYIEHIFNNGPIPNDTINNDPNNRDKQRNVLTRQNIPSKEDIGIQFHTEKSDYDKYIQDILNSGPHPNSNAINNPVNRNDVNDRFNGIQPDGSSVNTPNPIRFMGVGKTDVEQLNNVTYAITSFGINLMKSINNLQTGNIIVSPTSVATVLALLQQATFGEAQDQITRTLQMTANVTAPTYRRLTYDMKKRNSRNILTVSNNLFVGDGFEINTDFKESAIQNFGSEVTHMDFSSPEWAVNQINKWVAVQTHNKIENLLPPNAVGHNTQLIIANAVYFKGLWETKFKKEATKNLIFRLSSGESRTVPFMRMRHELKYGVDQETRALVLILPFERHQYSLILILPHQLSNVVSILGTLTNSKLVSYHNFEEIETQIEIPKFTLKSDTNLIPVLKGMGITGIFSRQTDLTGMGTFRTYSPEITNAIHTGYLSVDEQGLSAAAATEFGAVALSYDDPSAVFRANRPFLAVLWDTQFAIPLFIARIDDPSL